MAKQDTITVSLEAEKLWAIQKYMRKKDVDLNDEMVEQLQKLYDKYVPANVREYIEDKEDEKNKVKKKPRSSGTTPTNPKV